MPHIPTKPPPDNLRVFEALCEARARLFGDGEYSLHQTVDFLQAWAVDSGLVARIGQNAVQKIMAHAIAPYRGDLDPPPVD